MSNKVARLMHVVHVEAQIQSTYLPSSIILLIRAFAFSMVQTAMWLLPVIGTRAQPVCTCASSASSDVRTRYTYPGLCRPCLRGTP